jgi:hypothetical protein
MQWKFPLMKIPMRSHNSSASSMECAEISDVKVHMKDRCWMVVELLYYG